MRSPRRQAPPDTEHDTTVVEYEHPDEFLDRAHPQNDDFMRSVEHVQRKIMAACALLRAKQVNVLKSVFQGQNFTQAAKLHQTTAHTVSKLTKSDKGQRLLNLLQYHRQLLDGPNDAQRRNMLWRVAVKEEILDPKTSIKAIEALNKMHFQQHQLDNPLANSPTSKGGQVTAITISINQNMPKGALDT